VVFLGFGRSRPPVNPLDPLGSPRTCGFVPQRAGRAQRIEGIPGGGFDHIQECRAWWGEPVGPDATRLGFPGFGRSCPSGIPSILRARPAHVDSFHSVRGEPGGSWGIPRAVSATSRKKQPIGIVITGSHRGGFSWFWSKPSPGQSPRSSGLAPHMWIRSTACGASPEDRGDSRERLRSHPRM